MAAHHWVRNVLLAVVIAAVSSRAATPSARSGIPPTAEILQPADGDSIHGLLHAQWRGFDADGSIDHFRYAFELSFGSIDTAWTDVQDSSGIFLLPSWNYTQAGPQPVFSQNHRLLIESVDDEGLPSAPVGVDFVTWTYAPISAIDFPAPSGLETSINTGVSIYWHGSDPDGMYTTQPMYYAWRLLSQSSEFPIAVAVANPDSFRRYTQAHNFAGWSVASRDTPSVHFTNLNPGARYLFTVAAWDESGAYDPVWSTSKNMLRMRVRTGVAVDDVPATTTLEMAAPSPNPASVSAALSFRLPRAGPVSLEILDVSGRRVRALVEGASGAGEHRVVWDLHDGSGGAVKAGLYFVTVTAGGESRTRRLLVTP